VTTTRTSVVDCVVHRLGYTITVSSIMYPFYSISKWHGILDITKQIEGKSTDNGLFLVFQYSKGPKTIRTQISYEGPLYLFEYLSVNPICVLLFAHVKSICNICKMRISTG